jgi:hypothetical protein
MQELLVDFITSLDGYGGRGGLARMVGTGRTRVSPPGSTSSRNATTRS